MDYLDCIICKLESVNKNYKFILDQIEGLLNKHPNLRCVLDDEEITNLNDKDIAALIKIKNLYQKQIEIEYEELFFIGGRNVYYYFKKLGILNENVDN